MAATCHWGESRPVDASGQTSGRKSEGGVVEWNGIMEVDRRSERCLLADVRCPARARRLTDRRIQNHGDRVLPGACILFLGSHPISTTTSDLDCYPSDERPLGAQGRHRADGNILLSTSRAAVRAGCLLVLKFPQSTDRRRSNNGDHLLGLEIEDQWSTSHPDSQFPVIFSQGRMQRVPSPQSHVTLTDYHLNLLTPFIHPTNHNKSKGKCMFFDLRTRSRPTISTPLQASLGVVGKTQMPS